MAPYTEGTDAGSALSFLDERFQRFISGLPQDGPVWFCFFSSGLLHIVRHFLRFVPEGLNCALITSGLSPDEIAMRNKMTTLPAFDMDERVGSHEIFEFVFRNLDRPFGLVDSDCFVMNSRWFDECASALGPGVAMNSAFCYGPIPLAAPPFVAINPEACKNVEATIGGQISPAAYAYVRPGPEGEIDGAMVHLIEEHHERALAKVLSLEEPRLPFPQGGVLDVLDDGREVRSHERFYHRQAGHHVLRVVFDGMMLYQLLAISAGWRIEHFRRYPGTKAIAAEVVHAGGISYWNRVRPSNLTAQKHDLPWSAHIDALLLDDFAKQTAIPDSYAERSDRLAGILLQHSVDVPTLRRQLYDKLSSVGVDVSDDRWAAVLDRGR